eukprot:scaffold7251_cov43-Attheya_sp.AAC.3
MGKASESTLRQRPAGKDIANDAAPSAENEPEKKERHRKKLPGVQELLIRGAEDNGKQHPYAYLIWPIMLVLTFILSLFIFHIAPEGPPREKVKLPRMNRRPQ